MDAEKNLEKLVERQRAYFVEGKTLSVDMRLQALERLEKALREGEEELCRGSREIPDRKLYVRGGTYAVGARLCETPSAFLEPE